jgi:hypothetical protein
MAHIEKKPESRMMGHPPAATSSHVARQCEHQLFLDAEEGHTPTMTPNFSQLALYLSGFPPLGMAVLAFLNDGEEDEFGTDCVGTADVSAEKTLRIDRALHRAKVG